MVGGGIITKPWPLYPRERDPVYQEDGCASGLVLSSVKYLAPTEIQSPDRPARNESLYWLINPGHTEDRSLCGHYNTAAHPIRRALTTGELWELPVLQLTRLRWLHIGSKSGLLSTWWWTSLYFLKDGYFLHQQSKTQWSQLSHW
jgi:hypothetical protein